VATGCVEDWFCETDHIRDARPGFDLVILMLPTIKFILRSSINRLTTRLAVAEWEPCWVSLQTSAHILQNLLLWWNFSATLRGCAFFCVDNGAWQHNNNQAFGPPVFRSIEWTHLSGHLCPGSASRRSRVNGSRRCRACNTRLIYSLSVTSGGSSRSAAPLPKRELRDANPGFARCLGVPESRFTQS